MSRVSSCRSGRYLVMVCGSRPPSGDGGGGEGEAAGDAVTVCAVSPPMEPESYCASCMICAMLPGSDSSALSFSLTSSTLCPPFRYCWSFDSRRCTSSAPCGLDSTRESMALKAAVSPEAAWRAA